MGIFGDMDVEKISTNPYWVEQGEYSAVVDSAEIRFNEKKDVHQLVINYRITEEDSIAYDKRVTEWLDVYPDISKEDLDAMSADDRRSVVNSRSNLKRRLCGQPEQRRPGLGVSPSELNEDWKPESLVGIEVDLAVINGGSDNQFTNVRYVNKKEG